MEAFIAPPIGLIINHYNITIKKGDDDEAHAAPQQAKFIEMAYCLMGEDGEDEFYSPANTYSMN